MRLLALLGIGALCLGISGRPLPLRINRRCLPLLTAGMACHGLAVSGYQPRVLLPIAYGIGAVVFYRALVAGNVDHKVAMLGFVGAVANTIPIVVVGSMPTALESRHANFEKEPLWAAGSHTYRTGPQWIQPLIDWIRLDGLQAIVSPGDLVMAAAIMFAVAFTDPSPGKRLATVSPMARHLQARHECATARPAPQTQRTRLHHSRRRELRLR